MFTPLGFTSFRNVDSFRLFNVQNEKEPDTASNEKGVKEREKKKKTNQTLAIDGIPSRNSAFQPVSQNITKHLHCRLAFSTPDFFFIKDLVVNPLDSTKNVHSILKIVKKPYQQCHKKIYSYPSTENPSPSALSSFANWTLEQQQKAITKLDQLSIPIRKDVTQKIYALLQIYQKALCEDPNVRYPALYKVKGIYQDEETNQALGKAEMKLEIHSNKKATLIFTEVEKTLVGQGTSKRVWKVFSLGKPKVTAYTISLPQKDAKKNAAREEQCFMQFKGRKWLPKIYNIFYYNVMIKGKNFQQQIIEMRFHPSDLDVAIDAIKKKQAPENIQLIYSIQLMQAIVDLHAQGIVHRDLKPENILLGKKGIFLNDFGLSLHYLDPTFKHSISGSFSFIAPELLMSAEDKYDFKMDIWSAGCVLWLLWLGYDDLYTWYHETLNDHPNISEILNKMKEFDNTPTDLTNPIKLLIWKMLRFDPKDRLDALQVLEFFNNIKK